MPFTEHSPGASHSAKRPANRAPGSPAIWRHRASPSYRWGKQESMELVSLPKVTLRESGRAGICHVYPYWVTVSHRTHVIPHRHICTFCVLPPQWELVLCRQPDCVPVVRGVCWGGGCHRRSEGGASPAQGGNKKLPEAFSFKTALSQFHHMNRNLFIAI